jgi:hypothetical protein
LTIAPRNDRLKEKSVFGTSQLQMAECNSEYVSATGYRLIADRNFVLFQQQAKSK